MHTALRELCAPKRTSNLDLYHLPRQRRAVWLTQHAGAAQMPMLFETCRQTSCQRHVADATPWLPSRDPSSRTARREVVASQDRHHSTREPSFLRSAVPLPRPIYTHVLNRGGLGVKSPLDRCSGVYALLLRNEATHLPASRHVYLRDPCLCRYYWRLDSLDASANMRDNSAMQTDRHLFRPYVSLRDGVSGLLQY